MNTDAANEVIPKMCMKKTNEEVENAKVVDLTLLIFLYYKIKNQLLSLRSSLIKFPVKFRQVGIASANSSFFVT